MKRLLVGSTAATAHFPDFPRKPVDRDYFAPPSASTPLDDCHWHPSFEYILEKYPGDVAPPTLLYTLKVSHSFWPHMWEKTMSDIAFFQFKGVKLDEEVYTILYKAWEEVFGPKKAFLAEDNEFFFKSTVKRRYIHDDIHAAVAFNDEPMYMKIKTDKSKAMVSRRMFEALSYEAQIQTCLEEIYVVALERYLIPQNFRMHAKVARLYAAKDLITSMTKGWFPKKIVENWTTIHVNNRDNSFVQKFLHKLQEGKIRPSDKA